MAATDLRGDGSAIEDAGERVTIDRRKEPMRFRCPGHIGPIPLEHNDWEPTNNHILCASCARLSEQGYDVEAEYYWIKDTKTGELVSWARVDFEA